MSTLIEWLKTNAPGFLVVLVLAFLIVQHFAKQFFEKTLPTYMEEKGRNLATKQDIEAITRKTEQVQKEFKEDFERFSTDVHFKNDYYAKQYAELYTDLYMIIIQSEYMRHLMKLKDKNTKYTFEDYPFFSISPIHRTKTTIDFSNGSSITGTHTEEKIETPESKMTCLKMSELIIDKGEYASPELLKLAVSYRLVHGLINDGEVTQNEDFRLQGEIVQQIVKEYNELRRNLKMSYSQDEIETGRIRGMNDKANKR